MILSEDAWHQLWTFREPGMTKKRIRAKQIHDYVIENPGCKLRQISMDVQGHYVPEGDLTFTSEDAEFFQLLTVLMIRDHIVLHSRSLTYWPTTHEFDDLPEDAIFDGWDEL